MERDPILDELERRVYNLKTLCDVSKEVFSVRDTDRILNRLLLMTMGSVGADKGFVLTQSVESGEVRAFVKKGYTNAEESLASVTALRMLEDSPVDREPVTLLEDWGEDSDLFKLAICFEVEDGSRGVIGLGAKVVDLPYSEDEKEILLAIANIMVAALANAGYCESISELNAELREKTERLESTLGDLDSKVYHLKTLYDVSRDIFSSVDAPAITRNFLLMTMGSLGVSKGFIALYGQSPEMSRVENVGFEEDEIDSCLEWLSAGDGGILENTGELPTHLSYALPFDLGDGCRGLIGLGERLLDGPYDVHDRSLLSTLVNNFVIALRNANSFEKISRLNEDLRGALRKVELLESIKANLCKFVPNMVTRLIEKSPANEIRDACEEDISVMFLDIEGYTRMTEQIGPMAVTRLIEKFFSGFMEPIYAHQGDVVETAGDGLLVLFMNQDPRVHALEATRAAVEIHRNTDRINQETGENPEPVMINIGICSGSAFVGATKFESLTGSRWTYTAHGNTTNVAARICSFAKKGQLLIAGSTFERIQDEFSCTFLGNLALRNFSEQVPTYSIDYRSPTQLQPSSR
jgi:class 3 adenylate cyclase